MRVLVADRDATLLAVIASTFGDPLDIVTATGREHCLELLRHQKFDLVIACDRLADYTGLELLSEVATESPHTLRIFAATPARLKRLASRLDFFDLFRTLSYPLDTRKLLPVLALARSHIQAQTLTPAIRHVVLDEEWPTELDAEAAEPVEPNVAEPVPVAPASVRRVAPVQTAKAAPAPLTAPPRPTGPQHAAPKRGTKKGPPPRAATVPTESQRAAFQRALARRNAAKAETAAEGRGHPPQTRANGPAWPLNSTASVGSLSELARMAMAPGSMRNPRAMEPRSKRAVFFVGTGVVAALAVVGLSFELLSANGSFARSPSEVAGQRPLFGPPNSAPLVAQREGIPSLPFAAQPARQTSDSQEPAAPGLAQPDPVNPEDALPDPPPPPALETPGPMEPPSSTTPSSMLPSFPESDSQ